MVYPNSVLQLFEKKLSRLFKKVWMQGPRIQRIVERSGTNPEP
jgi:hypothetical protein